jgi:ATP-dependent 26S proteasome regulatory subunit
MFILNLADLVVPTAIEEGMRVGVNNYQYQIHIPLPPKIYPTVTMMQEEEKSDLTYCDVGGFKEQTVKLSEVMETPLLHVIQPLRNIFIKERPILLISFSAGEIRVSWHLATK